MPKACWKIDRSHAHLRSGAFALKVDLDCPHAGVTPIEPLLDANAAVRLLRLQMATDLPEESRTDAYVRENDLVAVYAETDARPFSPQVYWRALDPSARLIGGLELLVSTQTSSLDTHPEIQSSSLLPRGEVLRLDDRGEFYAIAAVNDEPRQFDRSTGTGCFLFRPEQSDGSYVEMVHPTDFSHSALVCDDQADAPLKLEHVLFSAWMEKGVIVRARVRGLFVDRQNDLAVAAEHYQEFCRARLPLTV